VVSARVAVRRIAFRRQLVTSTMNSEPSKNPKSYRTAAILFSVGGLIFIVVAAVSSKVGVFLAPGIALIVISIVLWQHSKKLASRVNRKEN